MERLGEIMKTNHKISKIAILISMVTVMAILILQLCAASKPIKQGENMKIQQSLSDSNTNSESAVVSSGKSSLDDTQDMFPNASKDLSKYTNIDSRLSSEMVRNTDTKPQIINNINGAWKEKYTDISITNEWLLQRGKYSNMLVLFGSLKSDPQQGVAQVVMSNADGSAIITQLRFLSPKEQGAVKVVGDIDEASMVVEDEDGQYWIFHAYQGFLGPTDPPITESVTSK